MALTRETVLTFTQQIDPATIQSGEIEATFAGQPLAASVHLSADGKRVTLFYAAPLPAAALVRVTVLGDSVLGIYGDAVDADGDGLPGGTKAIDFITLSVAPIADTDVCGRVFASELESGTNGPVNVPLEGVTVSVDGADPPITAVTDANGNFRLENAPGAKFFVHVDGSTVTNPIPTGGAYYPNVGKAWEPVPGQELNVGDIFLPLVPGDALEAVSDAVDVTIDFSPTTLSEFPEFAGTEITVPAGSLFADNGTSGGMVGLAPVDPDRLPGTLPEGLNLPLVITVQTDGATNFDVPAPVSFPNLPDPETGVALLPGEASTLWSFDHDQGRWTTAGSMTVSPDGTMLVTDPGVGIRAPGWHGAFPGGAGGGGGGCPDEGDESKCPPPPEPCNLALCGFGQLGCLGTGIASAGACGATVGLACVGGFFATVGACGAAGVVCAPCFGITDGTPGPNMTEAYDFLTTYEPQLEQIETIAVAALGAGPPFDVAIADIDMVLASIESSLGQPLVPYLEDLQERLTDEVDELTGAEDVSTPIPPPSPPYYAVFLEGTTLRSRTAPSGIYDFIYPLGATLPAVLFYEPQSDTISSASLPASTEGPFLDYPNYVVGLPASTPEQGDADLDALTDVAEWIVGTDPFDPDTDGDGILDRAELQQGLDPLDGLAVQTGVVATASTPDKAVDVRAFSDVAVVAHGDEGVSLFNVFNGMAPTIVAQVDTPGHANAVDLDGDTLVVADGPGGLVLIDVSDPPAAAIAHQVPPSAIGVGGARTVAVAGGLAYVGTSSGELAAVDIESGALLDSVELNGAVHDIWIDGRWLIVATGSEVHTVSLAGFPMAVEASVATPGITPGLTGRRKLFVGDGIAYSTNTVGYAIVDVSDPSAPVHLGDHATAQFGWKHLARNGSGLAVAAVGENNSGDGNHDVSLYTVGDPASAPIFVTSFQTPGRALGVSIYNGLAYVADQAEGLQVVNYREYDAFGNPPTVTMAVDPIQNPVEEGSLLLVTADVTDDVQVRNVELLVDGAVVAVDGGFPFQFFFTAPPYDSADGTNQLALELRASDTGGNVGVSPVQLIDIEPDMSSPRVSATNPTRGATLPPAYFDVFGVTVALDESIDPATVDASSVQLLYAGPDDTFGTGDDQPVVIDTGLVANAQQIVVTSDATFDTGAYELTLTPTIADQAGNALDGNGDLVGGDPFQLLFHVDDVFTVSWDGEGDGVSWHDPLNWSDDTLPGPTDAVFIDDPSTTVTHSSGTTTILSLGANTPWQVSAGALVISGESDSRGQVTVASGASLQLNTGDHLFDALTLSGNLTGSGDAIATSSLAWHSNVAMSGSGRTIIAAGATASASGNLPLSRTLEVYGTANINGGISGGTVVNRPGGQFNLLDLGSFNALSSVLNEGTFTSTATTYNTVQAVSFQNDGVVEVASGELNLGGAHCCLSFSFTNGGTFDVAAGTVLRIYSDFEQLGQGSITGSGALSVQSGANTFDGQVSPSSIAVVAGSATFEVGAFQPQDSVEITGGSVVIQNEFSVASYTGNGTASVTYNVDHTFDALTVSGSLKGSGDITVTGSLVWTSSMSGSGRTILSSGATASVSGGASLSRTFENHGTANVTSGAISGGTFLNEAGSLFTVSGNANLWAMTSFVNDGTMQVSPSGSRRMQAVSFVNNGLFQLLSGEFDLGGAHCCLQFSSTNNGTMDVSAGATLRAESDFDQSSSGAVTGAGTFGFKGGSGTIAGLFQPSGFTSTSGNYTFEPGAFDVVDSVVIAGGTLVINDVVDAPSYTGNGSASVTFNAAQSFDTLTVSGSLKGSGDVTVTSSLVWTGPMSGSGRTILTSGATASVSGGASLSRTFENHGTANLSSGAISGGTFHNEAGSLFTAGGTANLYAMSSFVNDGTMQMSPSGSRRLQAVSFVNNGTFEVLTGEFNLGGAHCCLQFSATNHGTMQVAAGAVLQTESDFDQSATGVVSGLGTFELSGGNGAFAGLFQPSSFSSSSGNYSFDAGAFDVVDAITITGGTLVINDVVDASSYTGNGSAHVTFNEDQSFDTLAVSGSLRGSGDVTITNALTWSGSMSGSGRTILPAGTTTSASGGCSLSRTFENHGDFNLPSGAISGGTFENASDGVFSMSGSANCYAMTSFVNDGTLEASPSGSRRIQAISFVNNGQVDVLAGELQFGGAHCCLQFSATNHGTIAIAGGATLHLPTTSSAFSNDGVLHLASTATLESSGVLNLDPGTTLELEIDDATTFGFVDVGQTVNFDGTLALIVDPGYSPVLGEMLDVMEWSSLGSGFSSVSGTDLGGGLFFALDYQPAGLELEVSQ